MIDVAILGATGYTALELIKILLRHSEVRITTLTTRQEGNPHIQAIHPSLHGQLDLHCESLTPSEVAERVDVVFCALPHRASMDAVPALLAGGCKVVDLSADYRLSDPGVYEKWYGNVHTDPTRLGKTVYGLPEIWAEKIPGQDLIANPGCYTSTSIIGLAPLLCGRHIEPTGIFIDAKSGVSGAGRTPKLTVHYPECNESVTAYSVGHHRHQPEIDQVLSEVSGQGVEVIFTPHLIPMDRGILCSIYATPISDLSENEFLDVYREFYKEKPFVRIVEHLPSTKDSAYTNFCDITVRLTRGRLIVLACLDNLIKGASGVAVQNFNLMAGFDETTALLPQSNSQSS